MLTLQMFSLITKNNDQELVDLINLYTEKYEITGKLRLAAFLAQCSHESGGFRIFKEGLNYSAKGLRSVFPKYFPNDTIAAKYERKPEAIANLVYANRMGNGPESSGDGYKYSGKGAIMVTGKSNVNACSQFLFNDDRLVKDPKWLETKEGAIASACWFWITNKLNDLADKGDIVAVSKKVNGGSIGLAERKELYAKAMEVLL